MVFKDNFFWVFAFGGYVFGRLLAYSSIGLIVDLLRLLYDLLVSVG